MPHGDPRKNAKQVESSIQIPKLKATKLTQAEACGDVFSHWHSVLQGSAVRAGDKASESRKPRGATAQRASRISGFGVQWLPCKSSGISVGPQRCSALGFRDRCVYIYIYNLYIYIIISIKSQKKEKVKRKRQDQSKASGGGGGLVI